MKQKISLLSLVILIILGVTFTSAFAASPTGAIAKKTDVPAVKATEKALERVDPQTEKEKDKDKDKDKDKEKDKSKIPPGLDKQPKIKEPHTPKTEKQAHKYLHLRGIIESASSDSLDLKTDSGSYTLAITADTEIQIPQEGKDASPTGLVKGAQASVKAIEEPEGIYTAVQIHVIPGKPAKVHHVGVVSEDNRATDGTLTITWKDGSTSIIKVTTETVYLPKDADSTSLKDKLVTIIAPRNLTGDDITAQGIVIHPEKEK